MTQYKVIVTYDADLLAAKVNEHISDGWSLWGGVSVAVDGNGDYYAQAMIRTK